MRQNRSFAALVFVAILGLGAVLAYVRLRMDAGAEAVAILVGAFVLATIFSSAVQVADQWNRALILRMGKFHALEVAGVRACVIHDTFSAHQGVEDDDLNIICLKSLVVGPALAWELVQTFLAASFSGAERHCRRLAEVAYSENSAQAKS